MIDPARILVTGGRGALGSALARAGCRALSRTDMDITDTASVVRALEVHRPALVINAAAYTAVDKAESEPDAARLINVDGAGNIASACAARDIPLIHISTDMVFSKGDPSRSIPETEVPTPNSVYGATKRDGEKRVLESSAKAIIARVSWLFSSTHPNFIAKILSIAQGRESLNLVYDEIGRPTPLDALAEKLTILADMLVQSTDLPQLLHLGTPGPVSRLGWAELIFEQSAALGGPGPELKPVPASAFPTPATRPRGVILDVSLADSLLGPMEDWRPAARSVVSGLLQSER